MKVEFLEVGFLPVPISTQFFKHWRIAIHTKQLNLEKN